MILHKLTKRDRSLKEFAAQQGISKLVRHSIGGKAKEMRITF